MPAEPKKTVTTDAVAERLQWIVLFSAVVALGAVLVYQQVLIDDLTKRINRSIESNDAAIAAIERKLIDLIGAPAAQPSAEAKPAQNVDIPGANASMTVPGTWRTINANGQMVEFHTAAAIVTVDRRVIGDADLQQWFKQTFGLPPDFVSKGVSDARKLGKMVSASDLIVTGPNQVKVAGNLAMDLRIAYLKSFDPENPTPQTQRIVAIRHGGDVVVVEFTIPTKDADTGLAELDQALSSLSFAQ